MDDWRSYDEVAETYERVHAPRLMEPARDLVAFVGATSGEKVLDVGAGTGVATRALDEVEAEAFGVDASLRMLLAGRAARPGLKLAAAGAIDLPFRDGTFDAAIGGFVLAHFARTDTALFDIVRVVRPGGRIAFSAWADGPDEFQRTWLELVGDVIPREMLEPAYEQAVPSHERFRDRGALEQALIDAGLRHVRSEPQTYLWTYGRDEYVDGLEVWATGRFVREMLGAEGWSSFNKRVHEVFAERFPDPLTDRREVLFAVGSRDLP